MEGYYSEILKKNIPAGKFSSIKCGGILKKVFFPKSMSQLCTVGKLIREEGMKYSIMGRMSNILVLNKGYNGLIINSNRLKGYEFNKNKVVVGSGEGLAKIAYLCNEKGLGGLEKLIGIPGSIGGAICMNSGCYDQEISSVIEKVYVYDLEKQETKEKSNTEMGFSYRKSNVIDSKEIIVGAKLSLYEKDSLELARISDKTKEYRNEAQPKQPSLGSVFKRYYDTSPAIFIEGVKLKGFSINDMQFSEKHANFIVNKGNGEANDYLELIELAEKRVYEDYGIRLEREVKVIGER